MREFASSRVRLRKLGTAQRAVYTVFLMFAVAGLGSAVLLYAAGPGWSVEQIRVYYRGGEEPEVDVGERGPGRAAPEGAGGPVIELPSVDPSNARGVEAGRRLAHPRSYRQILENTHQHLFMMPVYFLILAHLFALSGIGRAWLAAGIGLAAAGLAGHLAVPWLIRWVSGGWAWLMPVTLAAMLVGLGAMIVVPLTVMWWPRRRESERTPS